MADIPFAARLAEAGLRLSAEEAARLEAMVADMERGAAVVRAPLSYAIEPAVTLSLMRLSAPG